MDIKLKGKYLRALPLHHSQEVLMDNEKEFRISLYIYSTYDFWLEIQSMGDKVKVIKPSNLKELVDERSL